jgi:hypothetical protein
MECATRSAMFFNTQAYERNIGQWSRRLAPRFIGFTRVDDVPGFTALSPTSLARVVALGTVGQEARWTVYALGSGLGSPHGIAP